MVELVPPRKSLVIMLAILFSTAIFATSSSVVYSVNNFNEYIYGSEPNVLIIYDRAAQTPFTSVIPASYDLILNQIDGVELTSPELIIPGIIGDKSVIMRGVNISSFQGITDIEIIDGGSIQTNDRTAIWIGQDLANRLDLSTGDEFFYQGSLLNNQVFMKVAGIISGSTQIDDEVIAPLGVAEKLSRRDDEFNHIKVKYNPDITDKDTIVSRINSNYEIDVSLRYQNNTMLKKNIALQVFDRSGDQIYLERNKEEFNIELPFGEYDFVFSENISVVYQETRIVSESTSLEFIIPDYNYTTTITTSSQDPSGPVVYEIYRSDGRLFTQDLITPSQSISFELPVDDYEISFYSPVANLTESFSIDGSTTIPIDLSSVTYTPSFANMSSGDTIPSNGIIILDNIVSSADYSVYVNSTFYTNVSTFLAYDFPIGAQSIEIRNSLGETLSEFSITTTVDSGLDNVSTKVISFEEFNPNYNETQKLVENSSLIWSNFISSNLLYGSITIPLLTDVNTTIAGVEYDLNNFSTISISKPIINASLNMEIINDLGVDPEDIVIKHKYLDFSITPQKSGNQWFVNQVPVGLLNVQINPIGRSLVNFEVIFDGEETVRLILEPVEEISINKFLALRTDIDGDIATEFFNQELTGPFAYFRIALLAETITIIFLLLVNVGGVYAGIVSENRHELRTLKSLGFTQHQMIMSIIRGSLKISFPVIILGTLVGLGLSNLMLLTNNTILFGHKFIPVFPFSYWMVNIIVGHFLMYVGAYIGLQVEKSTLLDSN